MPTGVKPKSINYPSIEWTTEGHSVSQASGDFDLYISQRDMQVVPVNQELNASQMRQIRRRKLRNGLWMKLEAHEFIRGRMSLATVIPAIRISNSSINLPLVLRAL